MFSTLQSYFCSYYFEIWMLQFANGPEATWQAFFYRNSNSFQKYIKNIYFYNNVFWFSVCFCLIQCTNNDTLV